MISSSPERKQVLLKVDSFSRRGDGLASYVSENFSSRQRVEVAHALIGDEVFVELRRKRKGFIKGKLLSVQKPSPLRCSPHCSHTEICGGCSWQEMRYEEQLKIKENIIQKIFSEEKTLPILPCKEPWHYRNKMEFSFSQNRAGQQFLGLMIVRAERFVFNVEECFLASSWFSEVLRKVRNWWQKSGLEAYRPLEDSGSLRTLTLREGKNTSEKMIFLTLSGNPAYALTEEQETSFHEAVLSCFSQEEQKKLSLLLRFQNIAKKQATSFRIKPLFGKSSIAETLQIQTSFHAKELSFLISPSSFFQPNTFQAEKMYNTALELAGDLRKALVLDLYSGTGALGMVFAPFSQKVIGIELNLEAVEDAKKNLEHNQIENFTLYQGDVGKVLANLEQSGEKIKDVDLAIVDPPRAGLDSQALFHLKKLRPQKILYISCNPYTQEENIQNLEEYRIETIQPIDQFPHTAHIENIVLLKRRDL